MMNVNQHSSSTLTAERRAAIARMIEERGAVRVTDLASHFDVDATTIRRDMKILEEQGVMQRVHGGAVVADEQEVSLSPDSSEARVGHAVAEMVADGQTVFLGPGQLTLEVARCLAEHSRLTVVTNGLEVAHWIATHTSHTLIVTGGQVEERDLGLVGHLARAALSTLRADHVILELGGVSAVEGLTDDSMPQAEIAQMLLESGSQVIVLVQAERVGRVAATYIAPIFDADVIVTAREAPSPFLWDLSESGVRVLLA